jgi:hypothetical protein
VHRMAKIEQGEQRFRFKVNPCISNIKCGKCPMESGFEFVARVDGIETHASVNLSY